MTKAQLFTLLENVPNDANIVVEGYMDDIMGDYQYTEDFSVTEYEEYRLNKGGSLHMGISNYSGLLGKKTKVWVLS